MKKKELITAVESIKYDGKMHHPGATFKCDAAEAERLKGLGVAVAAEPAAVVPSAAEQSGASEQSEESEEVEESEESEEVEESEDTLPLLLEKLATAETEEALLALVPEEEPADPAVAAQITEAVNARLAELRG